MGSLVYTLDTFMAREKTYIYGKHVVEEALRMAPSAIEKVLMAQGVQDADIEKLLTEARIKRHTLAPETLPLELRDVAHQGVVAVVDLDNITQDYRVFAEDLEVNPDTALVLLDEIQDPQNVGAIIRSAAAFGVKGILVPEHNQAQITATVMKVSAGMIFRVPLVRIGNVNNTIRDLKERGFWIYGMEGEGASALQKEVFDAPSVFVLGNEGKGIRQHTLEACDIKLSIPMHPGCESLNVSASGAIALYAWSIQHPRAIRP